MSINEGRWSASSVRPLRISDASNPNLTRTIDIVDNTTRIFAINSIEELDLLTKEYEHSFDIGFMALMINTYTGETRMFLWIGPIGKWQEIRLTKDSSDSIKSGFTFEVETEQELNAMTGQKDNDTAFVRNYKSGTPSIAVYDGTQSKWIFMAGGGTATVIIDPQITSLSNSVGVAEIGSTVTDVTLTWDVNKELTAQSFNQSIGALAIDLRLYTITGANLTADTTYTLTISDGTKQVNKSTSVLFQNKLYWGVDPRTALISSLDITGLGNSKFASNKSFQKIFDCTAQYIYIAYPERFGDALFKVNGLQNSAWVKSIVSFANPSGFTENYIVYRSYYVQNGSGIQVEVS